MGWIPAAYPPKHPGHYLVCQETRETHRKYRFVRYWTGEHWHNPNEEQYGTIEWWCELIEFP